MPKDLSTEEALESLRVTLVSKEIRKTDIDQPVKNDELLGKTDVDLIDNMLTDPGISHPVALLKLSILRSQMVYKNRDKEIEAFVNANLREIKASILRDSTRALEYGFAPFEKRYEMRDGKYWYKEFIPLNPRFVTILIDPKKKGFGGIKHEFQYQKTVTLRPPYETYVYSHDVKFSNLYGTSQTMFAWLPWMLDREFWRFHAMAAQEFGIPTLIGTAPGGDGTYKVKGQKVQLPHAEILRLVLESIRNRTSVVLPHAEYLIRALLDKRTATWDFDGDHQRLDLSKARALLIPSELWREGGGSYAKARTQSFWFEIVIEGKLFDMSESVMRHIIKPLIILNFATKKKIPPLGEFYFEPHLPSTVLLYDKLLMCDEAAEERQDIDWRSVFQSFKIPMEDRTKDKEITTKDIPLNKAVIHSICQRAFLSGIEKAKEDFGVTGYVPFTETSEKEVLSKASMIARRVKNVPNPHKVLLQAKQEIRAMAYSQAVDFAISKNLICKRGA